MVSCVNEMSDERARGMSDTVQSCHGLAENLFSASPCFITLHSFGAGWLSGMKAFRFRLLHRDGQLVLVNHEEEETPVRFSLVDSFQELGKVQSKNA